MEYLEGRTLSQILKEKDDFLEDELIKKIIKSSLEGLSYIHKKNYIHRDIKPSNLMISFTKNGEFENLKVIDFGLLGDLNSQKHVVLLQDRCGTLGYLAPELIRKNDENIFYDQKVDIYSLGLILFQL